MLASLLLHQYLRSLRLEDWALSSPQDHLFLSTLAHIDAEQLFASALCHENVERLPGRHHDLDLRLMRIFWPNANPQCLGGW